jgi:ketosteroid isomerase-like protein
VTLHVRTEAKEAAMADPREHTIRRGYKAFGEGDADTFRSIYAPDVVHRQPGDNQTSGDYEGVDQVLKLYGKLAELSGGTIAIDLTSVESHGDKYVSVHRTTAERDGKTLDVDETIEFTFAGNRIARLHVSTADQAAEDAFWA